MIEILILNQIDQIILDNHLVKRKRTRRTLVHPNVIPKEDRYILESSIAIDTKLDPSFIDSLFKIIDERELKDVDIYNKAGIDRKTFSKIRNNTIKVSKNNAIALCLALQLDINTIEDLLSKAGYALSKSSMRDVIIRQCIVNNIYDINSIDEYLIHYEQKTIMKYK